MATTENRAGEEEGLVEATFGAASAGRVRRTICVV